MIKRVVQKVLESILPRQCLARVKRYLRRECRKPSAMKIRDYCQYIRTMNEQEIPNLPPFYAEQKLNDGYIDIILYGTPKSWYREMDRQGFDPIAHSLQQVIDFMERIEGVEEPDGSLSKPTPKKSNYKGDSNKSLITPSGNSSGSKFCLIHGKGTHSSDECKKLIADAKRHKTGHSGGKKEYTNKSWSKKADDERKKSQKELHLFVKKAVAARVSHELNSIESKPKGKRKKSDEVDLSAFDKDLKEFNYSEMDNLRIDSDDDKSDGEVSC